MLERANNTYSWWSASHVRSKQSKWIEQDLQEMEKKVQKILKIIEEDGDSFAKRAEMYYKKRPELIQFVEETYRAYRSMAERYHHISTELQNANNTIASVFPEKLQFSMEEEDHADSSRFLKKIPRVSQLKLESKKIPEKGITETVSKPVLSRVAAMEEIEKLQKEILELQTEKKFVKSSCENGIAKYWEIEKQIKEMEGRIFSLEDEFCDEESRSLMARSALKSCKQTLDKLEEKQERIAEETKTEAGRITDACKEFESINGGQRMIKKEIRTSTEMTEKEPETFCENFQEKVEYSSSLTATEMAEKIDGTVDEFESINGGPETIKKEIRTSTEMAEKKEPETFSGSFQEKVESTSSLTATEMAEKIDEIVAMVIGLETAVSTQNALVERLRIEIDELKALIQASKDEKETLKSNKMKKIEEKFEEIEDLKQRVEIQNDNIRLDFKEAHCNLQKISEKLSGVTMADHLGEAESARAFKITDEKEIIANDFEQDGNLQIQYSVQKSSEKLSGVTMADHLDFKKSDEKEIIAYDVEHDKKLQIQYSLQKGEESVKLDPEGGKISENNDLQKDEEDEKKTRRQTIGELLNMKLNTKFRTTLPNTAIEETFESFEKSQQIKELKISNADKDEEIKSLRQKLMLVHRNFNDSKPNLLDISDNSIDLEISSEKLQMSINNLLEENLDLWLKFSTSIPEIQRFETQIQDLNAQILNLEERSTKHSLKSDARSLYKHHREIQAALLIWLQKNESLKTEQQSRLSSLCNIEEEVKMAVRASSENNNFKSAKFQNEISKMKEENQKVADKLQTGNDRVMKLQLDIEKNLEKLNEEFGFSESKKKASPGLSHSTSQHKVPLRLFILSDKPKKQMTSLFSCISPSAQRKYHALNKGSAI